MTTATPAIKKKKKRHIPVAHNKDWCLYCRRIIEDGDLQIDHVIPKSRGGPDLPFNKAYTCGWCNHTKSMLIPTEFMAYPTRRVLKVQNRALRRMKKMGLTFVE